MPHKGYHMRPISRTNLPLLKMSCFACVGVGLLQLSSLARDGLQCGSVDGVFCELGKAQEDMSFWK